MQQMMAQQGGGQVDIPQLSCLLTGFVKFVSGAELCSGGLWWADDRGTAATTGADQQVLKS